MGVDYYNCGGCGKIHGDYEGFKWCSKCESKIFECCIDDHEKKYGLDKSKEAEYNFGDVVLKGCDNCNKEDSIKDEIEKILIKYNCKNKAKITSEILKLI